MRMHDRFILQVGGPPAVGVYPHLRELYALTDGPWAAPPSLRDLHLRMHGTDNETDTFYYATYEKQVVAALDVTSSRTARKVAAVHRLYTAEPFRRNGLACQNLLQASIDFQCLGGELMLTAAARNRPAYRWLRNVRFPSYPDTLFIEWPEPTAPESIISEWPPPELNPAAVPAGPSAQISDGTDEASGEWGGYDAGASEPSYSDGYAESDYGNYGAKPPLPEPTRTDGVALFYALFGRAGLNDFALSYFSVNLKTTVRPVRYGDWAALLLLLNWPSPRRLVHWHRPFSRAAPLDWEILELLQRVLTGRAAAVVLETVDTGIVGLATACLSPRADDPLPPPPGRRVTVAPVAGPAVVDAFVHPDFADRTPELLTALKAQRTLSGATAFLEETGTLKAHFEKVGFKPAGGAPVEVAALAPDAVRWTA